MLSPHRAVEALCNSEGAAWAKCTADGSIIGIRSSKHHLSPIAEPPEWAFTDTKANFETVR